MKVRYLGERLPKIVELPVPLTQKSLKTGSVICNPIGEFTEQDGRALIAIGGMFEEVGRIVVEEKKPVILEKKYVETPTDSNGKPLLFCSCGCGSRITWKPHYRNRGAAKYLRGHYSNKVRPTPGTQEGKTPTP